MISTYLPLFNEIILDIVDKAQVLSSRLYVVL